MDSDKGKSGYYQEIARAFLARRGAPLLLSPRDQAAIAAWEAARIPLDAVLEGIGRAFDDLKGRGRSTRGVTLAFCDRQVQAAFAQHLDRAAGRRRSQATGPKPTKRDKARAEIARALAALPAGDAEIRALLAQALGILEVAAEADALDGLEAEIEEVLWTGATAAEKTEAEAEARHALKGRRPAGFEDAVRRHAVMKVRARRRVPHVALHYY